MLRKGINKLLLILLQQSAKFSKEEILATILHPQEVVVFRPDPEEDTFELDGKVYAPAAVGMSKILTLNLVLTLLVISVFQKLYKNKALTKTVEEEEDTLMFKVGNIEYFEQNLEENNMAKLRESFAAWELKLETEYMKFLKFICKILGAICDQAKDIHDFLFALAKRLEKLIGHKSVNTRNPIEKDEKEDTNLFIEFLEYEAAGRPGKEHLGVLVKGHFRERIYGLVLKMRNEIKQLQEQLATGHVRGKVNASRVEDIESVFRNLQRNARKRQDP